MAQTFLMTILQQKSLKKIQKKIRLINKIKWNRKKQNIKSKTVELFCTPINFNSKKQKKNFQKNPKKK